jgi:Trp operon repressor
MKVDLNLLTPAERAQLRTRVNPEQMATEPFFWLTPEEREELALRLQLRAIYQDCSWSRRNQIRCNGRN